MNQKGLLCDSCGLWSHIKCVNVSSECYDAYSQLDEFNWLCPICLFDQLLSSEVIDGNDDGICISADVPLSLPLPIEKISLPVGGVRVIHHNVRGLLSKFTEISQWLLEAYQSPTVLCCSETWITTNDFIPAVAGFDVFCSPALPRPDKPRSTFPGSCIFVLKLLQPERLPICDTIEASCSLINVSSCFVTCKHHRIAIISVYRSPTYCNHAIAELRSVLLQLSLFA